MAGHLADADDDVGDLYADLDGHLNAGLAAGESGGSNAKDSDPTSDEETSAAATAANLGDDVMDYGSSSDSDDDLRIVLNKEDGGERPPPPPLPPRRDEVDEEEDLAAVSGFGNGSKDQKWVDQAMSSANDRTRSKFAGSHCKGFHSSSIASTPGKSDQDHNSAIERDFYFFLPGNRTVFDINIEAFQQKPWKQDGVDITDYFNFGLDEESWKSYCLRLDQFKRTVMFPANESSRDNQEFKYDLKSIKAMPSGASYYGLGEGYGLEKPKGRAIQVESGAGERVPSADMRRLRQRDSDVVIHINIETSSLSPFTSDGIEHELLKQKCNSLPVKFKNGTTERVLIDYPDEECVNGSSFVVDSDPEKETDFKGITEDIKIELDRIDSSGAKDGFCGDYVVNASSSADLDTPSEASTGDCYFKRVQRPVNAKSLHVGAELQESVDSDYCLSNRSRGHSNKSSEQKNRKSNSCIHTLSPVDDQGCNTTKLHRDGFHISRKDVSTENQQSDLNFFKSGYKATEKQGSHCLTTGEHVIIEKEKKLSIGYTSKRYAGKHGQKRSGGSFRSNNDHSTVHEQNCTKKDCLHVQRVASRNEKNYGDCYLGDSPNNRNRHTALHETVDEHIAKCYSSAKDLQFLCEKEYKCHLSTKTEATDDMDEYIHREQYFQEKSRIYGLSRFWEDEFHDDEAYSFRERISPEMRGKYKHRLSRFAGNSEKYLSHRDYHELLSERNGNHNTTERFWPDAGLFRQQLLVSSNLRNRYADDRRFTNDGGMPSKTKYCGGGFRQKSMGYGNSFLVGSVEKADVHNDTIVENGRYIPPAKKRLHMAKDYVNHKDFVELSSPKSGKIRHDIANRHFIGGRKLYDAQQLNSPLKRIAKEEANNFDDRRKINNISNIFDEKRHMLMDLGCKDADNRKFEQGSRVRDDDQKDWNAHLAMDKELKDSRHNGVSWKKPRLERCCTRPVNRKLEKMKLLGNLDNSFQKKQKLQNGISLISKADEDDETEEGELIEEHDNPDTALKNPAKVIIKSVIEARSSADLGARKVLSKDSASRNGATRECDSKRILEALVKMEKRRERFKEPIALKKAEEQSNKAPLNTSAITDDVKAQRPARKRRWGTG